MAYDGEIRFCTKIDNSEAQKDLNELRRKIRRSEEEISKAENARLPLTNQAKELGARLDEAVLKLEKLKAKQQEVAQIMASSPNPELYIEAASQKPELDASIKAQEKEVAGLQKKWDSINDKIDNYDLKIQQAKASIEANTAKAGELSAELSKSKKMKLPEMMDKARAAAGRFEARIISLGKRILVFSLVASAFRAIKNYMDKLLKSNAEFTSELAKLKGALATAFQPIYEILLPGLLAAMRIATAVVQAIAHVLSLLTGKTSSQSAKNAEALNEEADAIEAVGGAAEKANKELAGFDEINRLGNNDDGGGGGVSSSAAPMDFSDFDTDEYKAKIDELTVYLSGALLALGAILAFSGANIPLGIGLMAFGAVGLAAEIKANWGAMDEPLKNALTNTLGILGGFSLAIGAILAFSGASIPLGIALMAFGATALVGAAAINWDYIKDNLGGVLATIELLLGSFVLALGAVLAFSGVNLPLGIAMMAAGAYAIHEAAGLNWDSLSQALQGPIGKIAAAISVALLVIGAILAFSGANIPLGIALIAAGAAGLVAVGAANWNGILDKLKEVWAKIENWFSEKVAPVLTKEWWEELAKKCGNGLIGGFEGAVNGIIGLFENMINYVIRGLNKLSVSIPDWVPWYGGKQFGINLPEVSLARVSIPRLATGAVIPPNREFMAVLGDQKHGTNIEAPLETIQEAVALVMDDMLQGQMAGFEAVVAVLKEILEAIYGIEIGDEVIAKAAQRYQEKMAIVKRGG